MTDSPTPPRGRRRGAPLTEREEQLRDELRAREARHRAGAESSTGVSEEPADRTPNQPLAEPDSAENNDDKGPYSDSADTDAAPADEGRPTSSKRVFRAELQGLRAVAILMVVCYHIWFDRVSGGVDIFLLISAFLLTGSFVRKLESGRPLGVVQYWAHAFKRLVAPAAAVIIVTLGVIVLVYPPNRFADLVIQAFASLTYWENWHLALQGVDYYAADKSVSSPFQHFWSLSIQGQVFFLWPLLFALAALLIRRGRLPVGRVLLALFGVIFAASLVWSIYSTATDQSFAYFDTRTRLWEFAFGSLLALVLPSLEKRWHAGNAEGPARVRAALGWVATIAILSCGWIVDVENAFPGYIALWPLLAACIVIAMGRTHTRWGVDRFLSSGPLRWIGDISYSLYLVHWPLLITALLVLDVPRLNMWQGAAVVAASLLLGWLLTIAVDNPIRRWPWASVRAWRSGIVIVTTIAVALAPVAALQVYTERSVPIAGSVRYPGALSLLPDAGPVPVPATDEAFLPTLDQLDEQWVGFDYPCEFPERTSVQCDQLLPSGRSADGTIVGYGNSHMQQFLGALAPVAQHHGWQLERPTSSGCDYRLDDGSQECQEWNRDMRVYLQEARPNAVALQATSVSRELGGEETVFPGFDEVAQLLLDDGIDVIAVRDNPRFPYSVPECVFKDGEAFPACSEPRSLIYAPDSPAPVLTTGSGARMFTLDVTDQYCPDGQCRAVIGNVLVYLDDNHVTKAFESTMSTAVEGSLKEQRFPF